jgi:hypothetical protein
MPRVNCTEKPQKEIDFLFQWYYLLGVLHEMKVVERPA